MGELSDINRKSLDGDVEWAYREDNLFLEKAKRFLFRAATCLTLTAISFGAISLFEIYFSRKHGNAYAQDNTVYVDDRNATGQDLEASLPAGKVVGSESPLSIDRIGPERINVMPDEPWGGSLYNSLFSPDSQYVYTFASGMNSKGYFGVIDLTSFELKHLVKHGQQSVGLGFTSEYTIVMDRDSIAVYPVGSDQKLKSVHFSGHSRGGLIIPSSNIAALLTTTGLHLYSIPSLDILETFAVEGRVDRAFLASSESHFLWGNEANRKVYITPLAEIGKSSENMPIYEVNTIGFPWRDRAISSDGQYLIVTTVQQVDYHGFPQTTLELYNLSSRELTTTYDGELRTQYSWIPNTHDFILTNAHTGAIGLGSADTKSVEPLGNVGYGAQRAVVDPKKRYALTATNQGIWGIDLTSRTVSEIAPWWSSSVSPGPIAISPDGDMVVETGYRDIRLHRVLYTEDTVSPYIINLNPSRNSTDINPNTNIYLEIKDDVGVDQSSLEMLVNGTKVEPVITPIENGFSLLYDPPADFSLNQRITVRGNAKDVNGNSLSEEYSFNTGKVADDRPPFGPKTDYAVGEEPLLVLSTDLDSDGDNDLAVTNQASKNVSVLLNKGDGTFAPKVDYVIVGGDISSGICSEDLDSDGDNDLAVSIYDSVAEYWAVAILLNNGDGTFVSNRKYAIWGDGRSIFSADLDRDGDNDLAASANRAVSILLNRGDGTFAPHVEYAVGPDPRSVFSADLNGDGYYDLAVASGNSDTVSILLNNGDGTFAHKTDYIVGEWPLSVFGADLNGDGYYDLAVANWGSGNVSVLLNNGDGTFISHMEYDIGQAPNSVFSTDLDGDGDNDLAVSANRAVSILLNRGDGTFTSKVDYNVGVKLYSIHSADLDGDGDNDLIVADFGSNTISVLLNQSKSPGPTNQSPTLTAIINPLEVNVGHPVVGTASASDLDGRVGDVQWDFDGDNNPDKTGNSVSYIYNEKGYYTTKVWVTDNDGATTIRTIDVLVLEIIGIRGKVYDGETGGRLSFRNVELYVGAGGVAHQPGAKPTQIKTIDGLGNFSFDFTSEAELFQPLVGTLLYGPGYIKLKDQDTGSVIAEWTAHYSPDDFKAERVLKQEVYIYQNRARTDDSSLVQFVFLEKPETIHSDRRPMVLLHGLNGTSGYWGNIPEKLTDMDHDAWKLYYPGAQDIKDSAALIGDALNIILENYDGKRKVNIITHSMGGLVARAYTVWDEDNNNIPDFYNGNIANLVMIGPPNHGSELAARVFRGESFPTAITWLSGDNPSAPAYRDLSPGSNFVWSLNNYGVNNSITQLVIAGTSVEDLDILKALHTEAENHSDGLVSVSSASLLDKGIPLALVKLSHAGEIGKKGEPQSWLDKDSYEIRRIATAVNDFIEGNQPTMVDVYIGPSDTDYIDPSGTNLNLGGFQAKFYDANGELIDEELAIVDRPLKRNGSSGVYYYFDKSLDKRRGLALPAGRYLIQRTSSSESIAEIEVKVLQTVMTEYQTSFLPVEEVLGDFNGDGSVGFSDFLLFLKVYGTERSSSGYTSICDLDRDCKKCHTRPVGPPGYNPIYDLDKDGIVGFSDFLIFGNNYGSKIN